MGVNTKIYGHKIATLICVIGLFVIDYTIAGIGVGTITYIICFLSIILASAFGKKVSYRSIKDKKWLIVLAIVSVLIQILNYFNKNNNKVLITNAIICIIITAILMALPDLVSFKTFYQVYKIICFLISIGMIYQFIMIFIFGKDIYRIYLLPQDWAFAPDNEIIKSRPISIFPEPSFYGNFASIMVLLSLYKKEKLTAIYFFLSIILSTSLTGIVICLMIFLLDKIKEKKIIKARKLLIFPFIVIGVYLLYKLFLYGNLDFARYGRSFNIRVLSGYRAIQTFDWKDLLFGIGYGNMEYFIDSSVSDYLSGISSIIINYGIINFIIFITLWGDFYKRSKSLYFTKTGLICILFLMFGQAMFFNGMFFIWFLIIYILERDEREQICLLKLRGL